MTINVVVFVNVVGMGKNWSLLEIKMDERFPVFL